MKNKLYKILNIFIIISILFGFSFCYASSYNETIDPENLFGKTAPVGSTAGIDEARRVTKNFISNFIAIFQIIGIAIAVFMLMSLGMKYMKSSVEERAKIKEHAIVYVVGAVVFLGAAGILQIIQTFFIGNFNI